MKEGDLVWVHWGGQRNRQERIGMVLRYEPDYHGGTSMHTSRWNGNSMNELVTTPKRGRALVLHPETGDISWWDEKDIEPMGEEDGM